MDLNQDFEIITDEPYFLKGSECWMIFDLEELFKSYKNQRIYLLRMQEF